MACCAKLSQEGYGQVCVDDPLVADKSSGTGLVGPGPRAFLQAMKRRSGAAIQFHLRPAGGSSELHFGRLDTGMETAPAYTSTWILENW